MIVAHARKIWLRTARGGFSGRRSWHKGLAVILLCGANRVSASDTNWGKWGPDDQLGTLNYVTPEVTRHAATLPKQLKVYSLALPLASGQPGAANRRLERYMLSTGQGSGPQPSFPGDHLSLPTHGTTHWDGLAHVYGEGKIYNGYDIRTYLTPAGALKNGIHNAATKLVTRGVLVDVARYKGTRRLNQGYVITTDDMEGTARKQGVSFRQGDVVLIRTGWLSIFGEKAAEAFEAGEPGIGWAVSQWLKEKKVAAVAADNEFVEVQPCEPEAAKKIGHPKFAKPIHYELIRNQGMLMGELFQLDEIAEACAADRIYEFLFIAQPMKLTNATASPINPLVIK